MIALLADVLGTLIDTLIDALKTYKSDTDHDTARVATALEATTKYNLGT